MCITVQKGSTSPPRREELRFSATTIPKKRGEVIERFSMVRNHILHIYGCNGLYNIMAHHHPNKSLNELIQAIRMGEVVLWAGSGFSRNSGYPLGGELSDIIKKRLNSQELAVIEKKSNLDDVAEEFCLLRSRDELIEIIQDVFKKDPANLRNHEMVVNLPQIRYIITTNYDHLFERAYGDEIYKIVNDSDIPRIPSSDKIILYKIHGDIGEPDSIVITKRDYLSFYQTGKDKLIWAQIRSLLSRNSILLIGYSFEDSDIQYIFDDVIGKLNGNHKDIFLVSPNLPSHHLRALSNRYAIRYINSSAEKLMPKLSRVIRRHLKEDMEKEVVSPKEFDKILKKSDITCKIEIADGRPQLVSMGSQKCNPQVKGRFSITPLQSDDGVFESFCELILGKRFGTINLSDQQVKVQCNYLSAVGIDLIGPDYHISELEISSHPLKTGDGELILKSSGLRYDVKYNSYMSEFSFKVELIHPQFTLELLPSNSGIQTLTFNIQIDNIRTASQGYQVYKFFKQWMDDTLLLFVQNLTEPLLSIDFDWVNMSDSSKASINWAYDLFNALFEIQKKFGIYFDDVSTITEEDIKTIFFIKDLIDGKQVPASSISASEMTICNRELFETLMQNGTSAMKVSPNEEVTILGKSIKIPYVVHIHDPFFMNSEEIRNELKGNTSNVLHNLEIRSRSGKMYAKYEGSG